MTDFDFVDRYVDELEQQIDDLIYQLVDHRIEAGRYKADEREQRFEELKAGLRRVEEKFEREYFNKRYGQTH
jgi:hypothetical protein